MPPDRDEPPPRTAEEWRTDRIADRAATRAVAAALDRLGISTEGEGRREFMQDLRWMRERREREDEMGKNMRRAFWDKVLTGAATAAMAAAAAVGAMLGFGGGGHR